MARLRGEAPSRRARRARRQSGIVVTSESVVRISDDEREAWRDTLAAELLVIEELIERQLQLAESGAELDGEAEWLSCFTRLLNGPSWPEIVAMVERAAAEAKPGRRRPKHLGQWVWFCHAETVLDDDDLALLLYGGRDRGRTTDAVGSLRRRIAKAWPERDLRCFRQSEHASG